MSTPEDAPPAYIPTLYDETHPSKFYIEPSIMSAASQSNLIGYLDHHAPTTDGSFSICVANGEGVFISENLYNSIPEEHRPPLNTDHADQEIRMLSGSVDSIGTTFVPVILTNASTGAKFRIVLHALVVPKLFMGMFIGGLGGGLVHRSSFADTDIIFTFSLGDGNFVDVRGTWGNALRW